MSGQNKKKLPPSFFAALALDKPKPKIQYDYSAAQQQAENEFKKWKEQDEKQQNQKVYVVPEMVSTPTREQNALMPSPSVVGEQELENERRSKLPLDAVQALVTGEGLPYSQYINPLATVVGGIKSTQDLDTARLKEGGVTAGISNIPITAFGTILGSGISNIPITALEAILGSANTTIGLTPLVNLGSLLSEGAAVSAVPLGQTIGQAVSGEKGKEIGGDVGRFTADIAGFTAAGLGNKPLLFGMLASRGLGYVADKLTKGTELTDSEKELVKETASFVGFLVGGKVGDMAGNKKPIMPKEVLQGESLPEEPGTIDYASEINRLQNKLKEIADAKEELKTQLGRIKEKKSPEKTQLRRQLAFQNSQYNSVFEELNRTYSELNNSISLPFDQKERTDLQDTRFGNKEKGTTLVQPQTEGKGISLSNTQLVDIIKNIDTKIKEAELAGNNEEVIRLDAEKNKYLEDIRGKEITGEFKKGIRSSIDVDKLANDLRETEIRFGYYESELKKATSQKDKTRILNILDTIIEQQKELKAKLNIPQEITPSGIIPNVSGTPQQETMNTNRLLNQRIETPLTNNEKNIVDVNGKVINSESQYSGTERRPEPNLTDVKNRQIMPKDKDIPLEKPVQNKGIPLEKETQSKVEKQQPSVEGVKPPSEKAETVKQVAEPVSAKNAPTENTQNEKPSGVDALLSQARKYKSAEEFVNAQGTPVYHRSPNQFDKFDISYVSNSSNRKRAGWGLYFSDDIPHDQYGKFLYEARIPEKTLIDTDKPVDKKIVSKIVEAVKENNKNPNELVDFSYNGFLFYKTLSRILGGEKNAALFLSKNGINGLKHNIAKDWNYYILFNDESIKTKSQLTDIYNQAHAKATPENLTKENLREDNSLTPKQIEIINNLPANERAKAVQDFFKLNKQSEIKIDKSKTYGEPEIIKKGLAGETEKLENKPNEQSVEANKTIDNNKSAVERLIRQGKKDTEILTALGMERKRENIQQIRDLRKNLDQEKPLVQEKPESLTKEENFASNQKVEGDRAAVTPESKQPIVYGNNPNLIDEFARLRNDWKKAEGTAKRKLHAELNKKAQQLRQNGINAEFRNGSALVDGKSVRKIPELSPKVNINEVRVRPEAEKRFEELPEDVRQEQELLAENFVEPSDLPNGIGKKAYEKGVEDIKADNGREQSPEAKVVRDAAIDILENGKIVQPVKGGKGTKEELSPEQIKSYLNEKITEKGDLSFDYGANLDKDKNFYSSVEKNAAKKTEVESEISKLTQEKNRFKLESENPKNTNAQLAKEEIVKIDKRLSVLKQQKAALDTQTDIFSESSTKSQEQIDAFTQAKETINKASKESLKNLNSLGGGIDPFLKTEVGKAVYTIAKHYINNGVKTIGEFAKRIVKEVGAWIRPKIRGLWDKVYKEREKLNLEKEQEFGYNPLTAGKEALKTKRDKVSGGIDDAKELMRIGGQEAQKLVGNMDYALRQTAPAIYREMKHSEGKAHIETVKQEHKTNIIQNKFEKALGKFGNKKEIEASFEMAWMNRDSKTIKAIMNRLGMGAEYGEIKGIIDELGKKLGFEPDENYFPNVANYGKMIKNIEEVGNAKGIKDVKEITEWIDKSIKKTEKRVGRLTDYERGALIDGVINSGVRKGKITAEKAKVIKVVSPKMSEYYFKPFDALNHFIRQGNDALQTRELFKGNDIDSGIERMLKEGNYKSDDLIRIKQILHARYNAIPMDRTIAELNKVINTISMWDLVTQSKQAMDIGMTLNEFGMKATSKAAIKLLEKEGLTSPEKMGVPDYNVQNEITNKKILDRILPALRLLDYANKQLFVEAGFEKMSSEAKIGDFKEIERRAKDLFVGSELEVLKKEFAEGKPTGRTNLFMLLLLDKQQPMLQSSSPEGLHTSGSIMKMFWNLKKFGLRRANNLYYESKQLVKEGKSVEAAARLAKSFVYMGLVGTLFNSAADVVQGKDEDLNETAIWSFFEVSGINSYLVKSMKVEGLTKPFFDYLFRFNVPVVDPIFQAAVNRRYGHLYKLVPWLGSTLYNRFGKKEPAIPYDLQKEVKDILDLEKEVKKLRTNALDSRDKEDIKLYRDKADELRKEKIRNPSWKKVRRLRKNKSDEQKEILYN